MHPLTLCIRFPSWNTERPERHSFAAQANDQMSALMEENEEGMKRGKCLAVAM
jgi:hypothetical protein